MSKLLNQLTKDLTRNPLVSKEEAERLKALLSSFHLEKRNYEVLELYKNFSFNRRVKSYNELLDCIWYSLKYKSDLLYLYVKQVADEKEKEEEKEGELRLGELLNPPTSQNDITHLESLLQNYRRKMNINKKDI